MSETSKILSLWGKVTLFVVLMVSMWSCSDSKNTTSQAPELKMLGAYVYSSGYDYDSFVWVTFEYQDADGDIGLNEADTFGAFKYGQPNFYNWECKIWQLKNGQWIQPMNPVQPSDTLILRDRLPRVLPEGQSQSVHGRMDYFVPARPYYFRGDTVKYQFLLKDRSGHVSNLVETQILTLKHP